MELMAKVAIAAVILVLLFVGIVLLTKHTSPGPLTVTQAEALVVADLQSTRPNGMITLINESPSSLKANSWNFVFTVVYNGTRPCPTLFIEAFDYPATGLVPTVDNLYTSNCQFGGLNSSSLYYNYVISSPYIAIAESYRQNSTEIRNYVNRFGYNNMDVHAVYYTDIENATTPANITAHNAWVINYDAPAANYSEYVILGSSGSIIANYTAPHRAS